MYELVQVPNNPTQTTETFTIHHKQNERATKKKSKQGNEASQESSYDSDGQSASYGDEDVTSSSHEYSGASEERNVYENMLTSRDREEEEEEESEDEPADDEQTCKCGGGCRDCIKNTARWKWKQANDQTTFQGLPRTSVDAHTNSGATNRPDTIADSFFSQLSKGFWQQTTDYTNVYSKQYERPFQATLESTLAFVGVSVRMGIQKMPSTRSYWDQSLKCFDISSVMSKDTYLNHLEKLCIRDPFCPRNFQEVLQPVQPMINELQANMKVSWIPSHWATIDEAMIKTKCPKSGIRVYMKNKPCKWGIKVWCLVDSEGFLYAFKIYTGKKGNNGQKEIGLGPKVVRELAATTPKSCSIAVDNFFTNDQVMADCTTEGRKIVGTVKKARKFLKQIPGLATYSKSDKLSIQYFTCCDDKIMVCNWIDSAQVIIYSNTGKLKAVDYYSRHGKCFSRIPFIVKLYRRKMGAVDRFNRLVNRFSTRRGSKKWWKPIFFWLLDVAIVNAWTIWNTCLPDDQRITQEKFRVELASQLIGNSFRKQVLPVKEVTLAPQLEHSLELSKHKRNCLCEGTGCPSGSRTLYYCVTCSQTTGQDVPVCYSHLKDHLHFVQTFPVTDRIQELEAKLHNAETKIRGAETQLQAVETQLRDVQRKLDEMTRNYHDLLKISCDRPVAPEY